MKEPNTKYLLKDKNLTVSFILQCTFWQKKISAFINSDIYKAQGNFMHMRQVEIVCRILWALICQFKAGIDIHVL